MVILPAPLDCSTGALLEVDAEALSANAGVIDGTSIINVHAREKYVAR